MAFKQLSHMSPQLQNIVDSFIERMDMDSRDRDFFYDIIGFAYNEGKIKGKEEIIYGEETNQNEENGEN